MKILIQNKGKIINFPPVVYVSNYSAYSEVCYGHGALLGRYANENRAKDVLVELLNSVNNNQKMFIMPEK